MNLCIRTPPLTFFSPNLQCHAYLSQNSPLTDILTTTQTHRTACAADITGIPFNYFIASRFKTNYFRFQRSWLAREGVYDVSVCEHICFLACYIWGGWNFSWIEACCMELTGMYWQSVLPGLWGVVWFTFGIGRKLSCFSSPHSQYYLLAALIPFNRSEERSCYLKREDQLNTLHLTLWSGNSCQLFGCCAS